MLLTFYRFYSFKQIMALILSFYLKKKEKKKKKKEMPMK
jgi:hypothetical protein